MPVDSRAEEHPRLEGLRRDQAGLGYRPRDPQPGAKCFSRVGFCYCCDWRDDWASPQQLFYV